MDFLTDPIFTDLGRSDFIGGIDNEALDFGHLEQYMHAAGSASVGGTATEINGNICIVGSVPKTEPAATTMTSSSAPISNTNRNIATVSARVSLSTATTPIAAPLVAAVINNTQVHLPESPPDSGSEPPYSPLQEVNGLTLTTRSDPAATNGNGIYSGLSVASAVPTPHPQHPLTSQSPAIQMSPQFTPPHTQNHHLPHPHPHQHQNHTNPFPHHSNNHSQSHYLNNAAALRIGAERNVTEISIKHESGGLIMHESNMTAEQTGTNDTHIEVPTPHQSLLYPPSSGTELRFDSDPTALYGAGDYQHISTSTAGTTLNQAAICLMNPETSTPRVHVIGTSTPQPQSNRSSAPSTPIHRSSTRKRKMSTQIDCADFAESGLRMTPAGRSSSRTPQYSFASDSQQLGSISPVTVSLPTSSAELGTPALSRASLSPTLSTVNSNNENSMDGSVAPSTSGGDIVDPNALTPCIRFTPFQPQNWHKLCDQSLQELSVVYYRVDADKGFNFSTSDDAFVCQKKNHFQVTCHARLQGEARFVKTPSGLEKIKAFHLHFYGVKLESPNQTIRVEQSQSDRSKKPFHPVPIDLQSHIVSKITVGRLHFSETTNNNMRKKGRPNPEQRYFQLVVGLHVHTISGNFPIISQGSERIIVRASNPGQFESDVDLCWQRGITQDSIFHAGRVGINTDRPDESLVVHGNLKVSGHIVQPSDSRAKQEIGELDTSVQLRNLQKIRIVRYRYEPEFAIHSGLRRASASDNDEIVDTGVIAQEVREVIPDAVQEAGSITLPNGNVIENFLLVNKDRILMENIGAVKELCKVTGSLESRIQSLEHMNNRLLRAKEYDQRTILEQEANMAKNTEMCSNRNLQIIIFLLVIIMAACLTAVSTLYFLEHNKQHHNYISLDHLKQHTASDYRDSSLLSEQERHLMQLRNFLHSNASRTQGGWPDYLLGLTSARPPSPATASRNTSSGSSNQEIAYNESGEFYTGHGRTDELTVVMDKPVVSLQPLHYQQMQHRLITSAPPPMRNNKTIGSKNKHKWPLPQVVLRAATGLGAGNNDFVQSVVPVAGNIVEEISTATVHKSDYEESLNVNETTTSEKQSGDLIPQDFENNSIDIDARRELRKKSPGNKISSAAVLSNSASHESTIVLVDSPDSGTLTILVDSQRKHQEPLTSTASSKSVGVPYTTTATKLRPGGSESANIYNVYKAVSTPMTAHRTVSNLTGNLSLESPTLSNKSQGVLDAALVDTGDALDLQSLNNNNESADNPIAALFGIDLTPRDSVLIRRPSPGQLPANIWMQRKRVELEPFGAPVQCKQSSLRDDVSNCQSVCFEGSNQLSAPRKHSLSSPSMNDKNPVHERQPQNVDSFLEDVDVEIEAESADKLDEAHKLINYDDKKNTNRNSSSILPGKVSHATQAIAKQFPKEHLSDDVDTLEALIDDSVSVEQHFNGASKLGSEKIGELPAGISIESNRPPALNCWKITSHILAEGLNDTYGFDDFCPTTGRSLNLTYVIPISKYFKESSFELRFSSSVPLLWAVCHDSDCIKRDRKLLPPARRGHHLPREQNYSILGLTIPSHGYFVRELELRANDDLTKENLCQQEADEANTLFQYNIRILRDCD